MKVKLSALVLLGLLISNLSYAEDKKLSQDEIYKKLTRGLGTSSSPNAGNNERSEKLANKLSEQLIVSMKVVGDPKLIQANAKYMKSLYDALVDEGFSEEQAITLVTASLTNRK